MRRQVSIGPWIENGFYYDFDPVEPFQEKDLRRSMAKVPPLAVPAVGPCASSGRVWRLWLARHTPRESKATRRPATDSAGGWLEHPR